MIMIPISIFLDLSANAEYSVTALMKLPHNFDKKWSLFVLRAYSAVLKVRVVQFYNWFVVIFNFCIMGGGGLLASVFSILHRILTSNHHSGQLFSSHLIRVTTLAPTPQTMEMRCPNISHSHQSNKLPRQAPHALCVVQPPILAITVWHFISSDVGIFLCVELD